MEIRPIFCLIEKNSMQEKALKQKKKAITIVVAVIVLCAIGAFTVAGNRGDKVQDLLDLGQTYLEDGKYEQAIAAFESVLEVDPKEAKSEESQKILEDQTIVLSLIGDTYEAWADYEIAEKNFENAIEFLDARKEKYNDDRLNVKLADVYIAWADEEIEEEDYDRAEEILKEGKKKTGDKRLKKKLKKLHGLMYPNGKGASKTMTVVGTDYVECTENTDDYWTHYIGVRFRNPVAVEIDGETDTISNASLLGNSELEQSIYDGYATRGELSGEVGVQVTHNIERKMKGYFIKMESDDDLMPEYDFICLEELE